MNLIDRIEINYFRSVYSVSIKRLKDLNVFLGPNDAGKSNLLRALNLFFNNESGYDEEMQFLQDVTHLRQQEARDAKGRLTIWIKVHFNNVEKWKTLPDKFFIKKSWNRYSDEPEVSSNVSNQKSLTRFQNKLRFHYVPAVKERDIFSDYLHLLYETLSDREDIEFSGPADALSGAVNSSITELTDRIRIALAVKSNIQIPNDLESIFERLEFFTDQDGFRVPLSRRGDGLQVRHIPHILKYISDNNRSLNIWAYEEPENSLEMSNAFALAREFKEEFSNNNQIFITSHSPAFYSLCGKTTQHYIVKKEEMKSSSQSQFITTLKDLESVEVADAELGVAKLIADRSKEAFDTIERLKAKDRELADLVKPVVLTEGKTDAELLTAGWSKLFPDQERSFEIRSCDLGGGESPQETAGADELKKILETTVKGHKPVRIGVFDRDEKGTKCFEGLKKHKSQSGNAENKLNLNGFSGATRLPDTEWGSPYDDLLGDFACIEMMIPFENFEAGDVEFQFSSSGKRLDNSRGKRLYEKLSEEPELFGGVHFAVAPKFADKTALAKKLSRLPSSQFENMRQLFVQIESMLAELG